MTGSETTSSPRASTSVLERLAAIPGLDLVEDLVAKCMECEAPLLSEIALYLHRLGGKRIRPILCLTAAQACGISLPGRDSLPSGVRGVTLGSTQKRLTEIAAGIELIHLATLLHDDIIDNSPLRRHKPSPFAKYGLPPTLLAGDFLLVRAFGLCARLDPAIIAATERACVELTEGEIMEIPLHEATHSVTSSLDIARRKTAALFRLATFSAGVLGGLGPEQVTAMATFGEELGVAFQILDDVLDVTAQESVLGKRPGTDLRERKPSIVNVLWLESGAPAARALCAPPSSSEEEWVQQALNDIASGGVIDAARTLASKKMQAALDALASAISPTTEAQHTAYTLLYDLAQFTLARAM